jgi:hypothetical protein
MIEKDKSGRHGVLETYGRINMADTVFWKLTEG